MYWAVHLNGGPRRVEHSAVAVGDTIFFFGGYCETEVDYKQPFIVHVLNTRNYSWSSLTTTNGDNINDPIPYLLRGHSAVVYGKKIYIWGGRNYSGESNVLLHFDSVSSQWSWPSVTGTIPSARFEHSACVIANCMYVIGGKNTSTPFHSNDVYCLDLLSLHWKRVYTHGDPPPCLSCTTVEAVGQRMYMYGGVFNNSPSNYFPDVMYFDTITRKWHKPTSCGVKPPIRGKHSAFVHNDYLYVFGGYNAESGEHYNDLHRFHFERNEWQLVKTIGELPKARHRHSSLVVGEKVFVFGGTSCYPFTSPATEVVVRVLFHRNDLHVLDLSPSLRTLCMQVVIQHKLNTDCLPQDLKTEISCISPAKSLVIYV